MSVLDNISSFSLLLSSLV